MGDQTYWVRLFHNLIFPQSKVHEDVIRETNRFLLYFGGQKQARHGHRLLKVVKYEMSKMYF